MPGSNFPHKRHGHKTAVPRQSMIFANTMDVPVHGDVKITTVYTNDFREVRRWIEHSKAYLEDHEKHVIGMDVEYTPQPQKRVYVPVEKQKATLIQLCCGTRCLLYQVSLATEVSRELKSFLRESKYRFVGFRIGREKEMLRRWDIEVTNYLDIQEDWVVPSSEKALDSRGGMPR